MKDVLAALQERVTKAWIRKVRIESLQEEANSAKRNRPEKHGRERSIQRLNEMLNYKIKKTIFKRWKEFSME